MANNSPQPKILNTRGKGVVIRHMSRTSAKRRANANSKATKTTFDPRTKITGSKLPDPQSEE